MIDLSRRCLRSGTASGLEDIFGRITFYFELVFLLRCDAILSVDFQVGRLFFIYFSSVKVLSIQKAQEVLHRRHRRPLVVVQLSWLLELEEPR